MAIVFGMAALGCLVGIFAAWSASPIASIAIPLLFGLIGGASGFSILGIDFSKPTELVKVKLLGLGVGAFSVACLVSLIVGFIFAPTVLEMRANPTKFGDDASINDIVDNLIWRRKLATIGATPSQVDQALNALQKLPADQRTDVDKRIDNFLGVADASDPSADASTQSEGHKGYTMTPLDYNQPPLPVTKF